MAKAPAWAQQIVAKVAVENGRQMLPALTWRRSRTKEFSSGRAWVGRLVVTAGSDQRDAKRVLLHELAHWLTPVGDAAPSQGKAHNPRFYDTVRVLYRRFRIPLRAAMLCEAEMLPSPYAHWTNKNRRR